MIGQTGVKPTSESRSVREVLISEFGEARVRQNAPLASMTTFNTGGSADWFFETSDPQDIVCAVKAGRQLGFPVTVMGGGSNVLVGEGGVRGLVIRMWHGGVAVVRPGIVRADAGLSFNGLVRWTVNRGFAGLERWAGTPGTVGGAMHGNAHFQRKLISDHVVSVGLVDPQGAVLPVDVGEMKFGYDTSRLEDNAEVALWAEFSVNTADPEVLRSAARASLAYRKKTQPLLVRSAGCIFQNPRSGIDRLPQSAGALIERAGLKERSVGQARVSSIHGNFIVSDGTASASDIRELIDICRVTVHERFGVMLQNEIVYLGEF